MNLMFCSIYITVVTLECSLAFPFLIRTATVPRDLMRYQTHRPMPAHNHIRRTDSFYDSSNRFENLMFPDEQYIEQKPMSDSTSDESSDLHPIYVLPPPNFQPIVYPISRADGVQPGVQTVDNKEVTLKLSPRQYPYEYPYGLSSWLFGGMSAIQRGSFWEQLSSDLALHNPVKANQPNRAVVYVKGTQPLGQQNIFPTIEAHSVVKHEQKVKLKPKNNINNNNVKVLKTKLPVGLSSFFLGGMRGLSGRHWQMPSSLVSQIEFMPSDGKRLTEKDKKKTQYKPAVQFDDDSDFYNVIRHD